LSTDSIAILIDLFNSPERGRLWVVNKIVLGENEYVGQPEAGKEIGRDNARRVIVIIP
jgi:hypothetical protein